MNEVKLKFGITTSYLTEGYWSVSVGAYHFLQETYICIDFFKWSVSIGRMWI